MQFSGEATLRYATLEPQKKGVALRIHLARLLPLLLPPLMGCGGEAKARPPGCAPPSMCNEDPSAGAAGAASGIGGIGGIGGAEMTGDGGKSSCSGGASMGEEDTPPAFADWPMPSPPSSGLPAPAKYDARQPDVVLDVVTGLMWQRSAAPSEQDYAFDDAIAYCSELRAGGYCDWRLPSRIELVSLVDFTRADPAIDTSVFEDTAGTFFSASVARGTDARWGVASNGATSSILSSGTRTGGRSVRCVRAHTSAKIPEPRFAIEGQSPDQSVADRGTGLVWKRSPSAETYTFDEALAHCASVGAGWRLPNVKELQTIVDETALSGPAIDEQIFVGFPQQATAIFWSSSPSVAYPGMEAWFVNFGTGVTLELSLGSGVQTKNYVRCVR